jgi:hypothetical protein
MHHFIFLAIRADRATPAKATLVASAADEVAILLSILVVNGALQRSAAHVHRVKPVSVEWQPISSQDASNLVHKGVLVGNVLNAKSRKVTLICT